MKSKSDNNVYLVKNKPYTKLRCFGEKFGSALLVTGGIVVFSAFIATFAAAAAAVEGVALAANAFRISYITL
jgi:hypothetical protein